MEEHEYMDYEMPDPAPVTCGDCKGYYGHPSYWEYGLCGYSREWAESDDEACGRFRKRPEE